MSVEKVRILFDIEHYSKTGQLTANGEGGLGVEGLRKKEKDSWTWTTV